MDLEPRQYFPALTGSATVYLDSASSCQLPTTVIESISEYLNSGHGNPHRGMYVFSEKAENIYNNCREKVAKFINAKPDQIIFTQGTTESINLVAQSFRNRINATHSILVTQMEHHANLLPWQRLCEQTGARLNLLKLDSHAQLDLSTLENLLTDNCAVMAFTHCSNVTGTVNPVAKMVALARQFAVPTLVDGAQGVAHMPVDVKALDCDYYAFSGHKLYAPTGIGALYCREPKTLSPLKLGGGIVNQVSDHHYQLVDSVTRFEAGSANIIGIVGLSCALDFIAQWEFNSIHAREQALVQQLLGLIDRDIYQVISHRDSSTIVSVTSAQYHSHDIATILADKEVAVRAGHHCAQPCLTALGLKQCLRLSVGIYNTPDDIKRAAQALNSVPEHLNFC